MAPVADRAQQRAGQRAGPDAGLEDARARVEVGEPDDDRRVLGIDDRGAARHREHEVLEQRAEREVGDSLAGRHHDPLGATDEVVVLDDALRGVELLALPERDGVHPLLRVGELDAVTLAERSAPMVGAVGCGGCRHGRQG